MDVRYTVTESPLGRLLVAATPRGLCAVGLGEADPRAEVLRDEPDLRPWVDAILGYLEGRGTCDDLPVDVGTTAFRGRVFAALRGIPAGSTRTYGEVARSLGAPTAARAVARCCATNPVALVIPCHRVVRGDGHLGGYRWGLARKDALLEIERVAAGFRPAGGP